VRGAVAAHRFDVIATHYMDVPKYLLQSHAFLCASYGYLVALNLQRDQYLCIPRHNFELLGPWLVGWKQSTHSIAPSTAPPPEVARLAASLVERGVLCEIGEGAKEVTTTKCDAVTSAVAQFASVKRSTSSLLMRAPTFFAASWTTAHRLRREPLVQTVRNVERMRKHGLRSNSPFDFDKAAQLVSIFCGLRLFYPRVYLCLFDSLALLEFLGRYRLFPKLTFGVRAEPFEAHCWLQAEGTVLNDTLERVAVYDPIMYV
jgi:Transglutaminase-like superfamily